MYRGGMHVGLRISIVVVFAFGGILVPGTSERVFAQTWQIGEPIVMHWNNWSVDDEIAGIAADGNYNLVWDTALHLLDVAEAHDLRGLWVDPAFYDFVASDLQDPVKRAYLDDTVDLLKAKVSVNGELVPRYPNFYGYFLFDEPQSNRFSDLGAMVSYLRDRDPEHLAYINLSGLPGRITSQQQIDDYQDYLDDFIVTVQPDLLAYDYYPLQNDFSGPSGAYVGEDDLNGFLLNLDIVSNTAKQAGIPFMNTIQASRWNAGTRNPDSNELRYMTYSSLAYGAQGIGHYNWYREYTAPLPGQPYYNGDTTVGGIEPLSYDPLINTATYDALTPLNNEFVNVATELQGLEWIDTYLKGYASGAGIPGPTLPPGNASFSVTGVSDTAVYTEWDAPEGILLGFFGPEGATVEDATATLVQNIDYSNSRAFTLNGQGKLSVFDATAGVWTALGENSVALNLAPGHGVLVKLTGRDPRILSVDIEESGNAKTQPGFLSLPVSFNGSTDASLTVGNASSTGSATVTLDGNWAARNRGDSSPPNDGSFTENRLLRDSAFPNSTGPGPFTMTISGLPPEVDFESSIWIYDAAIGTNTFDVSANGDLIVDDFSLVGLPTENDAYRFDYSVTSDSNGEVVLSFSNHSPVVGPTGYAEFRINALQMTIAHALLGDMNGDDVIDITDEDSLIWALTIPQVYASKMYGVDAEFNGDIDGNGIFNMDDVEAFGDLLEGQGGFGVPEPASAGLLLCAVLLVYALAGSGADQL